MSYAAEREVAINAVLQACRLCQSVQAALVTEETMAKKDRSPVTVADFGAQALVSLALREAFHDDPIVGEEHAAELRTEEGAPLREKVVGQVQVIRPASTEAEILAAIDRGAYAGGPAGRHWALDPIDGTKGFLRGEQYAVALALIEEGQVVFGVLGCPNLYLDANRPDGAQGAVFVAAQGQGTSMRALDDSAETSIRVSRVDDPAGASFCESVESGHSSHGDAARVADLLGVTAPPVRMDSQAKYAAVARGDASIYLRLPTRADYEEKIWDHAAGWMVIKEAGGEVTDITGRPLDFSIGRTLAANKGVVATNGLLHAQVIEAVRQVVGQD